ncbi:hypothetical protein CCR75_006127 [Bremia lactucae]|uniref:Gcp-like domain-containing protein n=1 Tax=Bremia lactucae TaxID=4779 RepID=A0A976NZR5_BRELC|nr:hypothetical protein CCR75_006127 [Bremia lactucae]
MLLIIVVATTQQQQCLIRMGKCSVASFHRNGSLMPRIVPALAARAHAGNLPYVINAAVKQSGLASLQELAAVAVTTGPGLAPCLNVGLQMARQICLNNLDIAFLQINHLEAHILASRLPHVRNLP